MAHGSRKRWLGVLAVGVGVTVCTALSGCQNTDKAKDTKTTTPTPGLPGTPQLPPTGTGAMGTNKNVQANPPFNGAGANLAQSAGGNPFGSSGTGVAGQSVATNSYPPVSAGTNGMNNLKSVPQPQNFAAGGYSPQISPPAQPGIQTVGAVAPSTQPAGPAWATPNPPAPGLEILPPAPPPLGGSTGNANSTFGAPIAPPATLPGTGR